MEFKRVGSRKVETDFSGGTITSDGGVMLLRQVDECLNLLPRLAACFTDHRNPDLIEHSVLDLVSQRTQALALGYEDLNDHDTLRRDPLLATAVGKTDPTGATRSRQRDRGCALAGKSTLNRLELTPVNPTADAKVRRYKAIEADIDAIDDLFVTIFLEAHATAPTEIILDFDATDDILHGHQEGRFFQGYYRHYCYLPLYVFCGDHLLVARLRTADQDGAAGTDDILKKLVPRIRQQWPDVHIIVRGDSGFCRDGTMTWCEETDGVDYIFGLAKNKRLKRAIAAEAAQAEAEWEKTQKASRVFKDFTYRTLDSWSRARRVVGKAEHLGKGANPRFVVTSLAPCEWDARALYEDLYCARGEMENRIKEQQLYLFADRTSTHGFRSNQLRLLFSSAAYILMDGLRRLGLQGTELARARCDTIRLKLLKIGAWIAVSVRRVRAALSSAYPLQELFRAVQHRLTVLPRPRPLAPLRC
ncbi:MAG: IS1380 family transposase [bacterium]|nr:IS1380 family transposase [bacterium]